MFNYYTKIGLFYRGHFCLVLFICSHVLTEDVVSRWEIVLVFV